MDPPLTPESREGSKQWVKPGESAPKHLKTQQLVGKVVASVFWNVHGVIFIDHLEKGRTITGTYYAALLDWLVDDIRNKRPHLKKKKSFFMMTMHHLTHRLLHRQKSMNWVSNRFRIHRILQTWPLATIICSQTSRDGCVVDVLSRRKNLNGKQKGILKCLHWEKWIVNGNEKYVTGYNLGLLTMG